MSRILTPQSLFPLQRWLPLFTLLFFASSVSADDGKVTQAGVVESAGISIPCTSITVYQSKHYEHSAYALGRSRCDAHGNFKVRYKKPSSKDAVIYLIAEGKPLSIADAEDEKPGRKPVHLASMLGQGPYPDSVVINERTTVATAYAMAQFIKGERIGGPEVGLRNAAGTVRNLVNIENGEVGDTLDTFPNGLATSALPTMNTLANMLAACVRDGAQCTPLFKNATPAGRPTPHNTLDAMVNIAHFPGNNVDELLALAQTAEVYTPALSVHASSNPNLPNYINSWVLALRYNGTGLLGQRMDGPGNIAFDSQGNAWVNNNYAFGVNDLPDQDAPNVQCGSTKVMKLTPTGESAPGAPFGGNDQLQNGKNAGGLYGAGFGIAVDANDGAWVTNFGFQGQLPINNSAGQEPCPNNPDVLAVSVSQFAADGQTVSPDGNPSNDMPGGYRVLGEDSSGQPIDLLGQPQGVQVDKKGNVWVAGCIDGTITRFKHGNPNDIDHIDVDGLDKGFDVAIDKQGHVWMTGNGTNNVVEMNQHFKQVGDLITGLDRPMGIASDSQGNLWVAQAGIPNPPCPAILGFEHEVEKEIGLDGSENPRAAVGLIRHKGKKRMVTSFGKGNDGQPRDGLRWPWGIAVDGNDNVWVGNFTGQTIMKLCGAGKAKCPPGVMTGDPISPDAGYFNNALQRVTGIQVDPSGNVWMTNNWLLNGFDIPQNPGGHEVVIFVGLAAPVKTPMIGVPRQP